MNRRHFRRRLSFVGASLAGLGFGRGSATQQPPGPRSSPPRSFAGPPRAGAAPSRAAAVSGPPRAAASAASARAPPRTAAPARLCLDERLLALARRPIRMDSGPLDRAAPRASRISGYWRQRADVRLYIDGRWNCVRGEPHAVCRESRERIGEREAAAHRRRRTPRTRFRRSDLSNAPARPRGPETNQRRGKRAGTPAAARGFLPTAPTDVIASIAGFHRP